MFLRHSVARSPNHCGRGNATLRFIFIVVGVDVPVNNIKCSLFKWNGNIVFSLQFFFFLSYKTLHTAVHSNVF